MTKSKLITRSQVQDCIQVFAQVVENEEGIAVCDFMNALVMKSLAKDAGTEIFGELAENVPYPLSMQTMRDEPKCMLGEAVRKFRPTKPRVVVVVEKRYMAMAINALKKHHEDNSSGESAFSNLYPRAGFRRRPKRNVDAARESQSDDCTRADSQASRSLPSRALAA